MFSMVILRIEQHMRELSSPKMGRGGWIFMGVTCWARSAESSCGFDL